MEGEAPAAVAPVQAPAPVTEAPASGGIIGDAAPAPQAPAQAQSLLGGVSGDTVNPTPEAPASNIPASWYEGLSDDFKTNPNITKYSSLEDALTGQLNLVKKLGEKGIERPSMDAPPEDWDRFHNQIGRPESVDDYETWEGNKVLNESNELVPEFEFDAEAQSGALKKMHEAGFTNEQAKTAFDLFASNAMAGQVDFDQQVTQEYDNTKTQLMEDFGNDFEPELKSINNIANKLGIMETLKENGLINNYSVLKMIHGLKDKIGESQLTGDISPRATFDDRMDSLRAAPANQQGHPDYRAHQAKIEALYKQRYN